MCRSSTQFDLLILISYGFNNAECTYMLLTWCGLVCTGQSFWTVPWGISSTSRSEAPKDTTIRLWSGCDRVESPKPRQDQGGIIIGRLLESRVCTWRYTRAVRAWWGLDRKSEHGEKAL